MGQVPITVPSGGVWGYPATTDPSVDQTTHQLSATSSGSAPLTETVNTVAASGAALTIPEPSVATITSATLTANCTFTFPTAAAGKSFTLVLTQDGTGSRIATWPATAKWPAGTAPTLSTGAGKIDYLSFVCVDGTNWAGFVAGLDLR